MANKKKGNSKQDNKNQKSSGLAGVAFVIVVLVAMSGGVKCSPDPDLRRVPPSEPTDVGTLPPGLDK